MRQEPRRRVIGPVHVVHGQQQRSPVGQIRAQPVQAVHHAAHLRRVVAAEPAAIESEDRLRQVRRATEYTGALGA